jgi:hypothetical protein
MRWKSTDILGAFSGSVNKPNKKPTSSVSYLLHAAFLIGVFFDPEDGGDMFLQNIG